MECFQHYFKQAIIQHSQVRIEMDLTCAKFFDQTWQITPLNWNTNFGRDDQQEISLTTKEIGGLVFLVATLHIGIKR